MDVLRENIRVQGMAISVAHARRHLVSQENFPKTTEDRPARGARRAGPGPVRIGVLAAGRAVTIDAPRMDWRAGRGCKNIADSVVNVIKLGMPIILIGDIFLFNQRLNEGHR
jgi:hypothetical protein